MKYFVVIFLVCLPAVLCQLADTRPQGLSAQRERFNPREFLEKLQAELLKPFNWLKPKPGKEDNAIVEPQQKPQEKPQPQEEVDDAVSDAAKPPKANDAVSDDEEPPKANDAVIGLDYIYTQ